MTRNAWLVRTLVVLTCAIPLVVTLAEPANADRRRGGGDEGNWRGNDRGHHRGGHHGRSHHRYRGGSDWHHRGHRHHGSSFSGLFIWDMTPPPPIYVVVEPPPPVIIQQPPVYMQQPPAYCREYTTTAYVNGRPVETYGTACRQPDGSWRIVSMN